MKKSEIFFGALRVPIDFAAVMAAFLVAYYLRPLTDLIPGVQYVFAPTLLPHFDDYIRFAVPATFGLILLLVFGGLYSLKITESFIKTVVKIVFMVSVWLLFIIAYYFLIVHQLFFSRIALAHIWIFTLFFVVAMRALILLIQSFLLRFGVGQRRILFIGANPLADAVYHYFKKDRRYKVIGALAEKQVSRKLGALPVIGTLDRLEQIVRKYGIEEIIQAEPDMKDTKASDILGFCRSAQIKYNFIPDLLRLQRTNVEMEMADNIPLISLKQTPLDGWGRVYKRIFDLLFGIILLVLLIPIWLIVPLLIKLDSPGPVIYKSPRRYRDKIFNMYKFRSMKTDADHFKTRLFALN